jgi:hypothetical protein
LEVLRSRDLEKREYGFWYCARYSSKDQTGESVCGILGCIMWRYGLKSMALWDFDQKPHENKKKMFTSPKRKTKELN